MKEVKKRIGREGQALKWRITETLKERGENNEEERKGAERTEGEKVRNILSRVEEKTHPFGFCCS